jgi:hypothetical protein
MKLSEFLQELFKMTGVTHKITREGEYMLTSDLLKEK